MGDTRRWFWLGGVALLFAFIYLLHPILTPFLVALLLAYLFDPVVDRLEKLGLSRTWGVVTVFALFTLIVVALLLVLIPMLAKQLLRLYELAPQMLDWLQHSAVPWVQSKLGLADGFWKFDKVKAAISEHMGQTTDIVGVVLSQATASSLALIGWLANLVLIPVVAFYLLRDWDLMMAKIRSLLVAGLFQFGGDLYPMVGIVAVFMVGQALEGMVLTPLLVGDRIGLHPVAVIFAILAGGELFGFTGVLLALPVAAVIMVLVRHMHDLYKDSDIYSGVEDPDL
jgi:predicted PurR-regulated permease PerM